MKVVVKTASRKPKSLGKSWRIVLMVIVTIALAVWGGWTMSPATVPPQLEGLFAKEPISEKLQVNYDRGPDFPCPGFSFSCFWLDASSSQSLMKLLAKSPEWQSSHGLGIGFKHRQDAYVHFVPISLAQPRKVLPDIAYEVRVSIARQGPGSEFRRWFDMTFQPH